MGIEIQSASFRNRNRKSMIFLSNSTVECLAVNQMVAGSNPAEGANMVFKNE